MEGYAPAVSGAPSAIAQASVTPEICVKVVPLLVEWNNPTSELTHTSPLTVGLTTIFTGAVEPPRVEMAVKVFPILVDR